MNARPLYKKPNTFVRISVFLYGSEILYANNKIIHLTSNGGRTVTTKRRLNQASRELGLGFTVYQKNFVWYVDEWCGEKGIPFSEGMFLRRR